MINLAGNNTSISKNEIDVINTLSESYKEKMIFMSSAQVYGDDFKRPVNERQELSNMNDYSKSKISWSVSSHWGDFVRVNGRLTSDEFHRGLDSNGQSDRGALKRPEYQDDLGFQHF